MTGSRPVRSVTDAPSAPLGLGVTPSRRVFAGVDEAAIDPFLLMRHWGGGTYGRNQLTGTLWHPHRGFEIITYMLQGTLEHHDSTGGEALIQGGDTQWITAGAGILHIERPLASLIESGGRFDGVQLWLNLSSAQKWLPPTYRDIPRARLPVAPSAPGVAVRLLAGELNGTRGPGPTHTPVVVVHATLQPGASMQLPWPPEFNSLVYALHGSGQVGPEPVEIREGQLAVLGTGASVQAKASDQPAAALDLLLLGGQPIREPIAWGGPFVMNTEAEILAAFDDYRAGRLGRVDADMSEYDEGTGFSRVA